MCVVSQYVVLLIALRGSLGDRSSEEKCDLTVNGLYFGTVWVIGLRRESAVGRLVLRQLDSGALFRPDHSAGKRGEPIYTILRLSASRFPSCVSVLCFPLVFPSWEGW